MDSRRILVLATVVAVTGVIGAAEVQERRSAEEMADAASNFLSALPAVARGDASFAFESDERARHHFIPTEAFERHGVVYRSLNSEQKVRALDLLRSGLSQKGYLTAQRIMEVEGILGILEGSDRRFSRDQEDYWVSIFGTPAHDGTWGWRWEGHHLSLHFTVVAGDITVSTPTFLGANPAMVPDGPRRGVRAMREHEDTARELLASLDAGQREVAIFDDVAPTNIVTGAELVVDPLDPIGIRGADLSSAQRDLLTAVIDAYVGMMADDIAALRHEAIRSGGLDNTYFAWAGPTERGEVAYYRVQGPNVLIEFDNTQEDPNHIHAAFRDFVGDLGRDVLREHLARDHTPGPDARAAN